MDFNNNISTKFCLIFKIWCNYELILYSQSSLFLKYIFEIYFWNIFKSQLLPESTNNAKYGRDCTEENILGWDVIVSAFKSHIIQTLQTFSVLLYCYVMDKSGKNLLLHLLIRTSHKLLTLLKIFTRIYSIAVQAGEWPSEHFAKKQLKISDLQ